MAWLTGWGYRKSKHIDGSASGDVTDYAMSGFFNEVLNLGYGVSSDSDTWVFLNSHARSDFGDVRFTESDGVTLLDYYISYIASGSYCKVIVEIPSITTAAGADIYIYYGNAGETSAADGDATFDFFDDFPGVALDGSKWTVIAGAVTVSGGSLELTGTAGARGLIEGKTSFSFPKELFSNVTLVDNGVVGFNFCSWRKPSDSTHRGGDQRFINTVPWAQATYFETQAGGATTQTWTGLSVTPNYTTDARVIWENSKSRAYWGSGLLATHTTNVSTQDQVPWYQEGTSVGDVVKINYMWIRQFIDPEPEWGATGAEEEEGGVTGQKNFIFDVLGTFQRNFIFDTIPTGMRKFRYDVRAPSADARIEDRFEEWNPNPKFHHLQELLGGVKTETRIYVYKQHFGAIRDIVSRGALWVKGYALDLIEEDDFIFITTQSFYWDYQVCSPPTFDATRGWTYFEVKDGPALDTDVDVGGYVAKRYLLDEYVTNIGSTSVRVEGPTLNAFEAGAQNVTLDYNTALYDASTESGLLYTLSSDYAVVSVDESYLGIGQTLIDNAFRGRTLTFLTGGALGDTWDIRSSDANGLVTVALESGESGLVEAGVVVGDRFRINRNNTLWFKLMAGYKNQAYYAV